MIHAFLLESFGEPSINKKKVQEEGGLNILNDGIKVNWSYPT